MLRRSCGWRQVTAACTLALLGLIAVSQAGHQQDKARAGDGEDKPSPEAVKLLRLNVRTFLKAHDTDKDGKLSFKELQALFDRFDKDKDGFLDQKELGEAIRALAGKEAKVDQYVIASMREYDVNKDGKLSSKEVKLHFGNADTDKDGLLDENELVTAAARGLPADKKSAEADRPSGGGQTDAPPSAAPKPRRLVALLGLRVVIGRDDALGKVIDVVTDQEGRIAYVLVRDADGLVAVPWGALNYGGEAKTLTVSTQVTRANLKGVTFAEGRYPDFTSEAWLKGARAAWGERALSGQPLKQPTERKSEEKKSPERKPEEKKPPAKSPPEEKKPPAKSPPKEKTPPPAERR